MSLMTLAIAALLLAATPGRAADDTVLLVESDHEQGSTTFTDKSPHAHKIERAGDTHHSTAHKKVGGSSIRFDGQGDYLSIADHAAVSFGLDDFAVEFWMWPEGEGRRFLCGQAPANGADALGSIGIAIEEDGRLRAAARTAEKTHLLYAPPKACEPGQWHHVSFRRAGDALLLSVDDAEFDRLVIGPQPLNDSAEPFSIGRSGRFDSGYYRGHLDRFHVTRRPRRDPEF